MSTPQEKGGSTRVVVNTATDTGVGFEAGNVPIALGHSFEAAVPSIAVGVAALGARLTHEYKAVGFETPGPIEYLSVKLDESGLKDHIVFNNPVSRAPGKLFNAMVENPGVGVEVSAAGLAGSALYILVPDAFAGGFEAVQASLEWGEEAAILGCFAAANALNGSNTRFSSQVVQKSMQAGGLALATTGVMMAGGENVIPFEALGDFDFETAGVIVWDKMQDWKNAGQFILVGAAVQGFVKLAREKVAGIALQPQLTFAFGTAVNSVINFSEGNMAAGIANGIWSVAFVSLDAIYKRMAEKKYDGFYGKYSKKPENYDPNPAPEPDGL